MCQGPDGSNSPILRNTEKLMMLVAQGILPPEVRPPTLMKNPTSTYNSWLHRLPPPLRSAVLSKVPECNIQEHFLKVSGDAGEPALPHRVRLSLVPERNVGNVGNAVQSQ